MSSAVFVCIRSILCPECELLGLPSESEPHTLTFEPPCANPPS